MKLLIEPEAGVRPIVSAIRHARKSVDVLIFRLDRREVSDAMAAAVRRGVAVRALIAHANSGGQKSLRKLELQLLDAGVTVSRTAEDLVRYHGKMMIIDRRVLQLYGFNFTWLDTKGSRSFGVVTGDHRFVDEALTLFEADCAKRPYSPKFDRFVVSPENARERLTQFISSARKQLLIYDPKLSDPAMIRLLEERARSGIDVRIIGKVDGRESTLSSEKFPGKRFHVRAIIRDGDRAFIGSQSLRRAELDRRREIGMLLYEPTAVRELHKVFEDDWAETPSGRKEKEQLLQADRSQEGKAL